MMKWLRIPVVLLAFILGARVDAQSLFATLTGIVSDPSGAVVPGANVTLREEKSGSIRTSVTDSSGYFTFASVSVGDFTYELTVEAKGFQLEKLPGIALLGGEKSNVNVTMQVGNTNQTVTITGSADEIVPMDSGEKSMTLTREGTPELCSGWEQCRRIYQDRTRIWHCQWNIEQGQLQRPDDRNQRQWGQRQPKPAQWRILV
jgi:type 1 fimbria pilin